MRILLLGEASFVHTMLRDAFRAMGHDVILMSDGCAKRNCPRDIDMKRNMKYGKLGGITVLWKLLRNVGHLLGNDIVQISCPEFVPLRPHWNKLLMPLLKIGNKRLVKCCFGDDAVLFMGQAAGKLRYSDTHIGTRPINEKENKERISDQFIPEFIDALYYANNKANALVPCLYEYFVYYNLPQYKDKLYYVPLPIEIPHFSGEENMRRRVKKPVKVLVGIQSDRDCMKGAEVIAKYVERIAAENPGSLEVKKVYDVPYNDYLKMLDEADVLVDQLYSYTPSMNSLAAMAHGTVVIGGGEEEYYDFIGEKELRPIINVRPEEDEYNMKMLRETLLYPEKIEDMKRQGIEFVRKYHDHVRVAEKYIKLYEQLLKDK
ncbi:MAG: glycosyltransferase [Prevotella sp.]